MTTSLTKGIFIVAAKRTPFGTAGGKFVKTSSCDLQTVAAKAALTAANIAPEKIDNVVIGNVLSISSADGIFVARHTQLRCDIPKEVPALVVNRLCGTGFQSIVTAAQGILVGDSKIALTGGTDNMSQQPFVVRNVRYGVPLGSKIDFEDSLWLGLTDSYCNMPMGMTAEKLGAQYKLTRDEVDEFALRSQQLWKKAQDGGVFKEELAPVTVKIKGKEVVVDTDEHPKPQTTIEGLKKLKPVFVKDGLVTAGSASGICDGAGAVIIASEEAVKANNLTPLARLVGYGITGVDPTIMGIGPAPAIRDVLKAAGKTLDDLDMVEVNEAFGAQTLAVAKELKLDMNKLNMNGGAIALGHPLAASGARITAHMVHELRRRKAKLGVASACIGGGQGIALLIESC